MRFRRAPVGLAATLGLLLPALAPAARTTMVRDPRDARGIDIESVRANPLNGRRWRFVITFYARIPPSGSSGNEDLLLWRKRPRPLSGAPAGSFRDDPYTIEGPQTGRRPIETSGYENPFGHGT